MEIPNIFLRLSHFLHSFILFLLPKHLNPPPSFSATAATGRHKKSQPSDLRQVFDTFDENKDGLITKGELSNSLQNMGLPISDSDLTRLIERVDSNGDECIDVAEFEALYRTVVAAEAEEEEEEGGLGHMEEVFGVFDKDGDGYISEAELKSVLETLGLGGDGRSVEDCRRMIEKVDVDGDGRVSFIEFQLMMKDVPALALLAC